MPGPNDYPIFRTSDSSGNVVEPASSAKAYTLLTNASATGQPASNIRGGDYIWRVEGTFGGATVRLAMLSLDGTTYTTVKKADGTDLAVTGAASIGVGIGQGATVRAEITGASGTTSLNSNLAGLT